MVAQPLDLQRHGVDRFLDAAEPGLDDALIDGAGSGAVHAAHDVTRDRRRDGRHDDHECSNDDEDDEKRDHGWGGGKSERPPLPLKIGVLPVDRRVGGW